MDDIDRELDGPGQVSGIEDGDAFAESDTSGTSAEPSARVEQPAWGALETTKLQAEIKDLRDKYLRSVAEIENVKKRYTKERADLLRYAGEQLARDLLDVVDDLERASSQNATGEVADVLRGIQLIRDRFIGVLDRHGIKGADTVGKAFDPKEHEALTSVPTADHPPGTITEQFRRAYFFRDKLIRPAQVVVASAPTIPAAELEDAEPEEND